MRKTTSRSACRLVAGAFLAAGCGSPAPASLGESQSETLTIALDDMLDEGTTGDISATFDVETLTDTSASGQVAVLGSTFGVEYDETSPPDGRFAITDETTGDAINYRDDGIEVRRAGTTRFYASAEDLSADVALYDLQGDQPLYALFLLGHNGELLFTALYPDAPLAAAAAPRSSALAAASNPPPPPPPPPTPKGRWRGRLRAGGLFVLTVVTIGCMGSEQTCNGGGNVICTCAGGVQKTVFDGCGCGESVCNQCWPNTCQDECNGATNIHMLCTARCMEN